MGFRPRQKPVPPNARRRQQCHQATSERQIAVAPLSLIGVQSRRWLIRVLARQRGVRGHAVAWLLAWNTPFLRLIKCVVPGLGAWAFALRRQRSHVRIVSGALVTIEHAIATYRLPFHAAA